MLELAVSMVLPLVDDFGFRSIMPALSPNGRDRFRAAGGRLTPLGFDERFRRTWEYYLAYCEAGFRSGTSTSARWCSRGPEHAGPNRARLRNVCLA